MAACPLMGGSQGAYYIETHVVSAYIVLRLTGQSCLAC
jgi:hypothetical protein